MYEVGEIVELKSGGVPMTVTGWASEGTFVCCAWSSNDDIKTGIFLPNALKIPTAPIKNTVQAALTLTKSAIVTELQKRILRGGGIGHLYEDELQTLLNQL